MEENITRYIEVLIGMGRSCQRGKFAEWGLKTIWVWRIHPKRNCPELTIPIPTIPKMDPTEIAIRHFFVKVFIVGRPEFVKKSWKQLALIGFFTERDFT